MKQKTHPCRVRIDPGRCKGCNLCVVFCRRGCLALAEETNAAGLHYARVSGSGCDGCSRCALICPDTAIRITRTDEDENAP